MMTKTSTRQKQNKKLNNQPNKQKPKSCIPRYLPQFGQKSNK